MDTKAFMYILLCADGHYYTGSTKELDLRLEQHHFGLGSNFTRKRLPVKLMYYEEFDRIDEAFNREKQIQKWSKGKKEALIKGDIAELKKLSACRNKSHFNSRTILPPEDSQ